MKQNVNNDVTKVRLYIASRHYQKTCGKSSAENNSYPKLGLPVIYMHSSGVWQLCMAKAGAL